MAAERSSRVAGGVRGFTLVELVVVIVLVGLLTTFAARRLLPLREEAERAAMTQVLGGLRAALTGELLALVTQGRDEEIAALAEANPMALLLEAPANYLGELHAPDPASIPLGHWWWDSATRQLVYRVRHDRRFETALATPARARFRVALEFEDRDGDGRFDAGHERVGGARLRPVEPYAWRAAGAAPRPR